MCDIGDLVKLVVKIEKYHYLAKICLAGCECS
jgi:hypothetical protein